MFANTINDVSGQPPGAPTGPLPYAASQYQQCSSDQSPRSGIHAYDATIWQTVTSGNSCNNVTSGVIDSGTGTHAVCPSAAINSCECPASVASIALAHGADRRTINTTVAATEKECERQMQMAPKITAVCLD